MRHFFWGWGHIKPGAGDVWKSYAWDERLVTTMTRTQQFRCAGIPLPTKGLETKNEEEDK